MQTNIIKITFAPFLSDFDHFFKDLDRGFVNEFIINLYARSFNPGQDVQKPGQRFDEVMFIVQGNITISDPVNKEPFCILPTNCYLGDF